MIGWKNISAMTVNKDEREENVYRRKKRKEKELREHSNHVYRFGSVGYMSRDRVDVKCWLRVSG